MLCNTHASVVNAEEAAHLQVLGWVVSSSVSFWYHASSLWGPPTQWLWTDILHY